MSMPETQRATADRASEETAAATTDAPVTEMRPLAREVLDRGWYPVDLVILAYLVMTGLLILFSPFGEEAKTSYVALHFVFLAGVLLMHFANRRAPWPLHFFRHAYAFVSLPFFYDSVQHLNRLTTSRYFDGWLVKQEQLIFGCQPSQILYSALPSIVLSEFLHLTYLAYVLLTPVVALTLYFSRRFENLKEFATTVMGTFFFCYVIFTVFPVRGPFYYFGPIDPYAKGLLFPQVVHNLLMRAASVGTAFPSSHVAASVAIWLVSRRYLRRLSHVILVIAIGIFVGTVYGGFHYAVDALAGVVVGVACGLLGPKLHAWIRTLPGMALPAAEAAVRLPRPRRLWHRVSALTKRDAVTRRDFVDGID